MKRSWLVGAALLMLAPYAYGGNMSVCTVNLRHIHSDRVGVDVDRMSPHLAEVNTDTGEVTFHFASRKSLTVNGKKDFNPSPDEHFFLQKFLYQRAVGLLLSADNGGCEGVH